MLLGMAPETPVLDWPERLVGDGGDHQVEHRGPFRPPVFCVIEGEWSMTIDWWPAPLVHIPRKIPGRMTM